MQQIRLSISKIEKGQRKELYRNHILHDDGLSFPFDDYVKVFSQLYPSCFIEFTLIP